jgi:hypothetical protein
VSEVIATAVPSTAGEDRKGMLRAYTTCQSLEPYLLVDPVFRRFELYTNGAWQSFGPGEVVGTGSGPLAVDDFYDELDAEATIYH